MSELPPDEVPEGEPEEAEAAEPEAAEPEEATEDDSPRPLGVGIAPTGTPPVDATLQRLADADHLAVGGHLEVYEDVHRGLRETLASLDHPGQQAPHTPRS